MVARINTVAFHGVDIQNVDVQVQISSGLPAFAIVGSNSPDNALRIQELLLGLILLGFLLFPRITYAGDIYKIGQMTCDEKNDSAMIHFGVVYNKPELPKVHLPLNLETEFGHLAVLSPVSECQFHEGREILFSYGTGQVFPYGQCGGDPSAHFSLIVDGQPIFYKKSWNNGGCSNSIDPFVLILDDQRLISCKGPENYSQAGFEKYSIAEEDCLDISERLGKTQLSTGEFMAFEWDQEVDDYHEVSKDSGVCSFLPTGKTLRKLYPI